MRSLNTVRPFQFACYVRTAHARVLYQFTHATLALVRLYSKRRLLRTGDGCRLYPANASPVTLGSFRGGVVVCRRCQAAF